MDSIKKYRIAAAFSSVEIKKHYKGTMKTNITGILQAKIFLRHKLVCND